MMKIAYIVPKLAQRGPVTVVYELVRQMVAHGHDCTVFYFDEGADALGFPCATRRLKWLFGRTGGDKVRVSDRSTHGGAAGGLDFDRFDIVHSHGLRPDAYVFLHKPARCRARCLTTLHNYVFDDLRYQYNGFTALTAGRLWLALLRRHDRIVTLSRDAMRYYSRYLPAGKLAYAYNTRRLPDTWDTTAEQAEIAACRRRADARLLGVHAELTARKGIDQLLRVLPDLPDFELVVVGEGRERAVLAAWAAEAGLADRVHFLGYRPDAYRYLPLYDLYLLPSRSEGFPLALLEAAAYGAAVVCSDLPVFQELVTDREAAFFTLEDPDSLRAAILDATARKTELTRRLHERYLSAFSPEHFYARYLEIYQQ